MTDILKMALSVALGILLLDAIALTLWMLSGQYPTDGYYFGSITAHLLGALIN